MRIAEKARYFEARAAQEKLAAERASCSAARHSHLALSLEHERAAERERLRLSNLAGRYPRNANDGISII